MIAALVEAMIQAAACELVNRRFAGKYVHLIVHDDRKLLVACAELGCAKAFGPYGQRRRAIS